MVNSRSYLAPPNSVYRTRIILNAHFGFSPFLHASFSFVETARIVLRVTLEKLLRPSISKSSCERFLDPHVLGCLLCSSRLNVKSWQLPCCFSRSCSRQRGPPPLPPPPHPATTSSDPPTCPWGTGPSSTRLRCGRNKCCQRLRFITILAIFDEELANKNAILH